MTNTGHAGSPINPVSPASLVAEGIEQTLDLARTWPEPDHWHASAVTLAADRAGFTEADLNEATERLRRLGRLYVLRFAAAGPEAWDVARDPNWSLRQIAEHVAPAWYAEQVGDLSVMATS